MGEPDDKERNSFRRKMERVKARRDQGDLRGAFSTKLTNPNKPYKRIKIDVKDYDEENDTDVQ